MEQNELEVWKLVLLLVILPPVGAYFVWTRKGAGKWHKALALLWAAAVMLLLLTARAPSCTMIDAQPWTRPVQPVSAAVRLFCAEIT